MKRPQYVFRPNLSDPQHRRAWALLQQMPSAKRKEFLVQAILATEQTDRLEKSMGINFCCFNLRMAEEFGYHSQWNTVLV